MIKWYDIRAERRRWKPLNIIISSRGIGKTYSTLLYLVEECSGEFLYLRNTDVQIKTCSSEFGNPFKAINKNTGRELWIKGRKECGYIYEGETLRGYASALSTFENMRGVDLSGVTDVIFDEFIEKAPLRFDQFSAFLNFYETVNRNRELTGGEPLRVFMLSNAQRLSSPILAGFGLIPTIEEMIKTGQTNFSTKEIWLSLPRSEVSEAKKKSVLYQAANGTRYYSEAIENKFANDSFSGISKRNLNEYKPICSIDDYYIYKHKSDGSIYVCTIPGSVQNHYDSRINSILLLRGLYPQLALAYAEERLFFDSFTTRTYIIDLIG